MGPRSLEAQQRYFSYRAILVATVSPNSFVLVLMGYHTIIRESANRALLKAIMSR